MLGIAQSWPNKALPKFCNFCQVLGTVPAQGRSSDVLRLLLNLPGEFGMFHERLLPSEFNILAVLVSQGTGIA